MLHETISVYKLQYIFNTIIKQLIFIYTIFHNNHISIHHILYTHHIFIMQVPSLTFLLYHPCPYLPGPEIWPSFLVFGLVSLPPGTRPE